MTNQEPKITYKTSERIMARAIKKEFVEKNKGHFLKGNLGIDANENTEEEIFEKIVKAPNGAEIERYDYEISKQPIVSYRKQQKGYWIVSVL